MTETQTEGLNRLDEDRALSMADEGGAAAAAVEAAPPISSGTASVIVMGALLSILAVNLLVLWRTRCR